MISRILKITSQTTAMRLTIVLVAVVSAYFTPRADANTSSVDPYMEEESQVVSMDTVWVKEPAVGDYFITCPVSPLDILTQDMREKLVNLKVSGEESKVLNSVYTLSELDTLTTDYMKITLTDVSTLTINKFVKKKETILMTVYTIGGEGRAADSDIEFYDSHWHPLKTKDLWETPEIEDFLEKGTDDKVDLKHIAQLIPFPTFQLIPSPDGKSVAVTLTVGVFLSEEAKEELKPYLVRDREWVWDGKKFKNKQK